MLLALLSDIHANGPALEAVLARVKGLGVAKIVFLGDIVGYGPDPVSVIHRVADHVARGAIVIRGNHDEAALMGVSKMNKAAAEAIAWTHAQLGADEKSFLSAMPLSSKQDDILFVHAEASHPARWIYVTDRNTATTSLAATDARITFCGHVHVPALYYMSAIGRAVGHLPTTGIPIPLGEPRKWLAVCGAVGQPRDNNPAASFATFDTVTLRLTYHRVSYDAEQVAMRIRAAGLPESLALRLVKGQ